LRPANRSKSNGMLFFNMVNRGNKGGLPLVNANVPAVDVNNLVNPGDGFLERNGYKMIWFGWQADVMPGGGRMTPPRLATGDARRSLEERYPNKDAHVAAFKKAAESLVKQRFLLPDGDNFSKSGCSRRLVCWSAAEIEMARLEAERSQLSQKLEERKLIDRAKGILRRDFKLSEENAYLTLQSKSRKRGKPMREIAESILLNEDLRRARD
jgi:hypothetical protein